MVERHRGHVADLPPLAQMLFVDTRLTLPDELLLIADKMSMAESVELRVPFLDEDLVQLVESMHPSQKVHGRTGKWIHKQAMRSLLPAEIVNRRKLGWETPLGAWLRPSSSRCSRRCCWARASCAGSCSTRRSCAA